VEQPLDIKAELRELILRALSINYVSKSCHDGVLTGNHYQSVNLGETQTTGFRKDRGEILDRLDFEGKRVLDLGSNLGEVSRAARARGARLVNGFEFDQYFLQIANLLNAYHQVTSVSFYRRNIVDPSVYKEHYDIVLAFSVFVYVEPMLSSIARITDQAFVLETHKLEGDFVSTYLEPVLQYFPYYRILGESDYGTPHDASEVHSIVVFAKRESALTAVLKERPLELGSNDAERLTRALDSQLSASPPVNRYIDGKKTPLTDTFFSTLDFDSTEDLLVAIAGMEFDLDTLAKSRDLAWDVLGGWIYWVLYIKGYLQHKNTGVLGNGNMYYEYLTKYFGPRRHDPGLVEVLADTTSTTEFIARRFSDFDFFRYSVALDPSEAERVDPVTVVLSNPPPNEEDAMLVYEVGSDVPLSASIIDGYHRLFLARLFKVERLPCRMLSEK
jgi:SAM-dependent methyltransferase